MTFKSQSIKTLLAHFVEKGTLIIIMFMLFFSICAIVCVILITYPCCLLSRQDLLERGMPNLFELQKVFHKCADHMQQIFKKLKSTGSTFRPSELTNYRRFCQAIIILKHMQRPSVVEGFTVSNITHNHHIIGLFLRLHNNDKNSNNNDVFPPFFVR